MDNSSPVSWSCQRSRQSLEICEGHAIADRAVLISGVCLDRSILGVHDFQNRRFATRVTKHREPQAICCEFSGTMETGKFVQGRVRLGVQGLDLSKKLALRQRKLPLGLRAPQLSLLDAALRGAPVPDGNVQSGRSGRTQIRNTIRTVHGELRGINAIPIIETQGRQIAGARESNV